VGSINAVLGKVVGLKDGTTDIDVLRTSDDGWQLGCVDGRMIG
jgi:hypothetical protein